MMRASKLICLALLLGGGLAGCATFKAQTPAAVVEESQTAMVQVDGVGKLPQYFEQVKRLPAPELGKEYERVRQAFAKDKGDIARLQLALFATLSNASFGDNALALGLLEPMLKEKPGSSPARSFAFFLYTMLAEQRRQEDGVQGLSQKLKEAQRRETEAQRREAALQEKLDALSEMETKLMQRDRARPGKKQ